MVVASNSGLVSLSLSSHQGAQGLSSLPPSSHCDFLSPVCCSPVRHLPLQLCPLPHSPLIPSVLELAVLGLSASLATPRINVLTYFLPTHQPGQGALPDAQLPHGYTPHPSPPASPPRPGIWPRGLWLKLMLSLSWQSSLSTGSGACSWGHVRK